MRDDEEAARSSLDKLLSAVGESCHWVLGDEPPDYWLHLPVGRFAVEITQVTRQVRRGGFRGSELQVEVELNRLLRGIADRAFADDLIRGYYRVRMAPVEHLGAAAPVIEDRLREFFRTTRDCDHVGEKLLWGKAWGARWSVSKIDGRDALIDPYVDSWGLAPFKGDIWRMLRRYVDERLKAKSRRLAKLPRCNRILVLIDAFIQPDDDQWATVLETLDTSPWHTVARVGGSNPPRILQSANPDWLATPTSTTP